MTATDYNHAYLKLIASRPALAEAYALKLLQGPTIEDEIGRHQWCHWANTIFVEQRECDCWFCERKRASSEV